MARAVYKITNLTNGKFYIGSSINTRERFKKHKQHLRRGNHHSYILQRAWDKYGAASFAFELVQIVPERESLEYAENQWLKEHVGKKHCYNVGREAKAPMRGTISPKKGVPLSDEQKKKISKAVLERYEDPTYQPRLGKKHSPETRAKIGAAIRKADAEGRGKRHHDVTDETRAKMSEALKGNQCAKGHIRTAAHRKHLSEANKGNQHWLGKTHTDESRAKMGKGLIEVTTGKEFAVMNDAVKFYGMPSLTQIYRQMKSGKPITRGKFKGLMFAYKGSKLPEIPSDPIIPDEYAKLPRTRGEAKEGGFKQYYTGIPCNRGHLSPRAVKGTCIFCRREDEKNGN